MRVPNVHDGELVVVAVLVIEVGNEVVPVVAVEHDVVSPSIDADRLRHRHNACEKHKCK